MANSKIGDFFHNLGYVVGLNDTYIPLKNNSNHTEIKTSPGVTPSIQSLKNEYGSMGSRPVGTASPVTSAVDPAKSQLVYIGSSASPSSPKVTQFFDAPLATKYGMSAETAYSEEMANTAHQREMADLKAAGLNPVLAASYGGASVVSGNDGTMTTGSASGYSRQKEEEKGYSFGSVIGDIVTVATKGRSGLGKAVGNLVDFAADAISDIVSAKQLKK